MKNKLIVLCFLFISGTLTSAQPGYFKSDCDTSRIKFRANAEIGFIAVLAHHIQLGESGTYFDYVNDGGQDVLFPSTRFSLELDYKKETPSSFFINHFE